MKCTIREARKLAKDLKKKYGAFCHISIDFDMHSTPTETIGVYVEDKICERFNTIKEAREYGKV